MAKSTSSSKGKAKVRKNVSEGIAHVHATFNNTIITISDRHGDTLCWASAGNSGFNGHRNSIGWPAKFDDSLCVGATRQDGAIAGFSSGGRQMDLATPGKDIWSAAPSGGFTQMKEPA